MPFPWALWLCRCVQTTAAVLLAGTATLRLLALGSGLVRAERWPRLAWASWTALLVAGVFLLALTAAEMSGEPFAQVLTDGSLARALAGTRFGAVWRWRMALLGGWLVVRGAAAVSYRQGRPQVSAVLAATEMLLDAALLASLVWVGHAPASDRGGWLLPVDMVHALAAGAWPGGLLPLFVLLARARTEAALLPAAETITRRFSRLSVVAVGLLAFSGVLNGVGLVGTFAALWSSLYGRLVLGKAMLFGAMVALGAVNRRVVKRRPDSTDPAHTVRWLWRNVAWECALGLGVLLATEALATNAPPMIFPR